ncbi:MAG: aquaporin family protein [Acidobacteriota bacterium]|nr:aquaporin family protein [Acidobacteriota bacterium]
MRKILAEFLGTGLLVAFMIGSGIMATNLSQDVAVQLMMVAASTALGLSVLIRILGPISGGHFNPAVTLVELINGSISLISAVTYVISQTLGALAGAMLGNAMFKHPLIETSTSIKSGSNLLIGEVVATAGLILVIKLLVAHKNSEAIAFAVPAWIASAFFFTSSTSFANPAVTIGRTISNSFAGIAPESVGKFIAAQTVGALLAVAISKVLIDDK